MRIRSLHIIRVFIKHHGREKYVHVNRNLTTVGNSQPSLNNRKTLRKIFFKMTVGKAVFNLIPNRLSLRNTKIYFRIIFVG